MIQEITKKINRIGTFSDMFTSRRISNKKSPQFTFGYINSLLLFTDHQALKESLNSNRANLAVTITKMCHYCRNVCTIINRSAKIEKDWKRKFLFQTV